ncbi:proteasome accessory factor PafA2 [Ornithinimicrobium ciconiae]|uniref:Proteasome accessory factor PafA2 n=1 Tax=Ornithinimicrobium ciconiae TaxID=2594265 RepID=A0A516GB72_9MICO|nr:depupylase/deamidase Dop [Ornithinimicrobium ciconiae]QDO88765.1 proteasome accessory factor PafA2 [Ornithinimicrobium ciconiae]
MSVRRVMGTETEYGVTRPGDPRANPVGLSGLVVRSYASAAGPTRALPTGSGWDYADESPLRDARGFEVARALADISQLTDVDDPTTANSVLSNGARLYVDHAHPEYSSPEVTTPLDAVRWDRAGDEVMLISLASLAERGDPIRLYKNNVDGKGASYGTHENYLVPREVPFLSIAAGLLPFFVARQVLVGAGRVGQGQFSENPGFQISQRADYIEAEVGLETTLKRPIVNTRDEPHAFGEKYRRLHVIVGDATLCDVATLLKVGTTSLVLGLIEAGRAPALELEDPVSAIRAISHDPALRQTVRLVDGRELTALDLLSAYREAVDQHLGDDLDEDTSQVLEHWDAVAADLATDPMRCAGRVDWVTKLALLEGYRRRDGLEWDDARLSAIDIQWSDIDPARGLAARMRQAGRIQTLVTSTEVATAVVEPPEQTRAWFRGQCVSRYPGQVRAASWDSVVFEPAQGSRSLRRVQMPEPLKGTRADIGALLDSVSGVDDLLTHLVSPGD